MQESQSQSDFKLPFIEYHTQHRLPIRMDPSYRLKHTNPIRVNYQRYMDRRSVDEVRNETYYLEKFAQINKYPYVESNKYESRNRELLEKQKQDKRPKIRYQKPKLKYFSLDDSDTNQDQVENIFGKLKSHQVSHSSKVFISQ